MARAAIAAPSWMRQVVRSPSCCRARIAVPTREASNSSQEESFGTNDVNVGMEHAPLLSVTLTPYTAADAERLAQGLSALLAEDPTLSARPGPEPGETTIGVIGELQLDIVVHRLAREFAVTAAIGRPQVEYRERVTRHAEGEMKNGRGSPAIPEYAHVKVRVAPRGAEEGNVVNHEVLEGTIPAAFMPAVYEGVADALNTGVLAGYPLADVEVTIFDGTYHDVDSTASAFRL